jgi:two-component system chemotaxis response regulator CheB
MKNKIRVLVVDDSALVRQSLASILESDPMIEVMGTASDPFAAAKKISVEVPDVITLDVEMPKMDGLTFLKKIMAQHPIPVIILSGITQKGSVEAIKALEYGAVEVIPKPRLISREFFDESKIAILDAVRAAAISKLKRRVNISDIVIPEKLSADVIIPETRAKVRHESTDKVIAVGASTGGTEAIKTFLEGLTSDSPAVVIVQHMPEMFTHTFAQRLDNVLSIHVKEAADGDQLLRGQALIAPGSHHMLIKRKGKDYFVEIKEGPLVNRHRPSVDVLFRSVARTAGNNAIGIILTGMGDDGARGLLEMKEAGAFTIAQDEKTCVVYGMPKEAVKLNAVDKIIPIEFIAGVVAGM